MLKWLSLKSLPLPSAPASSNPTLPPPPPPPPSHSQGNSTEPTPATSTGSSPPAPNISIEYDRAVQAHSYNEIRSVIQAPPQAHTHQLELDEVEVENDDEDSHHRHVLAHALQPDRDRVQEALATADARRALTRLVSAYFDHSESTCDLCLLLHRSVRRARATYAPLYDLLAVLPADESGSFSKHLCDRAFDLFEEFDCQENPFLFPDTHNFAGVRGSFSDLKLEIERRRRRCHARIRLFKRFHTSCVICLVVTSVGAVISAALVTAHAVAGFAAVAAAPLCRGDSCFPKRRVKKELKRLNQLNAASKGTLVMNDIDTINSLVDRLQTAVEGDRALVRIALNRGRERHLIQEVLKQLRKNQLSFEPLLKDLEEQIYLCFNAVNKARLSLLQEIFLYRNL